MAALREMGLTAALLAATGGAALATWSYFSARRRKAAAARDTQAEPEGGKGAPEAEAVPGAGERRVYADIPPQQKVAEDRAGADTRHDTALTPEPALPVQPAEAADLPASTALTLHGPHTGAEDLSACTASRHDAGLTQHGPHTEELTTCTVLTQHGPDPGAEELTVSTALTQHSPHTGAEELTVSTAFKQHGPDPGAEELTTCTAFKQHGPDPGAEELTTCTAFKQLGPDPGAEELTTCTAFKQHGPHTGAEELMVATAFKQHSPHTGAEELTVTTAFKQHSFHTEAEELTVGTAFKQHGPHTGAEELTVATAFKQHSPHTEAEELTVSTALTQHSPHTRAEELTVSTASRHDIALTPQAALTAQPAKAADLSASTAFHHDTGLTLHSPHTGEEELTACTALTQHGPHDGAVDMSASAANHNEGEEKGKVAASGEPPVRQEASSTHSSAPTPPQVKTSPSKQVIVLGLDGSGKTSVLNSMAANKGNVVTTPTGGVNALCVNEGNSKMEFLEIGGSEQLRPYWKMYLSKAFAVIFVVDAADHSRLPLAKRHLHQLIQQDAVLPLIVLANKQDLEHAYHITEIHDALALSEICESRKLFLIGTHVTSADSEMSTGIQDAKEYLVQLFSEHSV